MYSDSSEPIRLTLIIDEIGLIYIIDKAQPLGVRTFSTVASFSSKARLRSTPQR